MSEALDREVVLALDRAGLRAVSCRHISAMRGTGRAAYRIDLEDGKTIKARRLESEEAARSLLEIRRALPPGFAPAFARHGPVLLEQWIEGEELRDKVPAEEHLSAAGTLLARLHATVLGAGGHDRQSTAAVRTRVAAQLRQLAADGQLDQKEARLLGDRLLQLDPRQAAVGLVHTDFCGENMVVDGDGRLWVVDNERLGIGILAYDLARAWYRWALPDAAWERFRAAYAAAAPLADPLEQPGFWNIAAVVGSAVLRLRLDRTRAHVPLDRLRGMAVALGEGPATREGR